MLDCVSYVAAISGSTFTLAALYSLANGSLEKTLEHFKSRMQVPFLDLRNLELLTSSPTNDYLLSGIISKTTSKGGTLSIVDIYGILLSSRLYVPGKEK